MRAYHRVRGMPGDAVRNNAVAMSVAGLVALVSFTLPWFRFETTSNLAAEPGALAAFERDFAPAGPLIVFTRLAPTGIGLVARLVVGLALAALIMIVATGVVVWQRSGPYWSVRVAVIAAGVILVGTILAFLFVGASLSFGYPYPHTIPMLAWWLVIASLGGVLYVGYNLLHMAKVGQ